MKVSDDLHNGCHEANQIYALVEADAERQVNEKTEFVVGEKLPIRRLASSEEIRHANGKRRQF